MRRAGQGKVWKRARWETVSGREGGRKVREREGGQVWEAAEAAIVVSVVGCSSESTRWAAWPFHRGQGEMGEIVHGRERW